MIGAWVRAGKRRGVSESPLRAPGSGSIFVAMPGPFEYADTVLVAGGVSLEEVAAEHGTPLYVYHRPEIASRIAAVREAFAAHLGRGRLLPPLERGDLVAVEREAL